MVKDFIDLLDHKLTFIKDIANIVSIHSLMALLTLSAVATLFVKAKYASYYSNLVVFIILVLVWILLLMFSVIESIKYCRKPLNLKWDNLLSYLFVSLYLSMLATSLFFSFKVYEIVFLIFYHRAEISLDIISKISLPYTLLMLIPSIMPSIKILLAELANAFFKIKSYDKM